MLQLTIYMTGNMVIPLEILQEKSGPLGVIE
jgi:hypothetical protein